MYSYSFMKHVCQETKKFVRYKNPPHHWAVVRKKVHPVDKALNHFDDFYKQVFDNKWDSIRKGLLKSPKYMAIINNYGDDRETMSNMELQGALNVRNLFRLEKGYIQEEIESRHNKKLEEILKVDQVIDKQLEEKSNDPLLHKDNNNMKKYSLATSIEKAEIDARRLVDSSNSLTSEILYEFVPATKLKGREDFIPESSHYKLYDTETQFNVQVEREYDIHFPEHLNVYCYERNNKSDFDNPKQGVTGVLNYYLMNGGSILPVLALDLAPGHKLLDMCASPGGKSLLAIQTFYPEYIVSNDLSIQRLNRVESVYEQFLYDFKEKWVDTGRIKLTQCDGRHIVEDNFDRILVDVPCTNDRHSLKENDNNIFKSSRIKERLQLPELQRELLFNALKLVRKGGIVVYSTCSLSPIQNDGVVHMALKQIWEETNMDIVVKDLTPALLQTRSVFELADRKLLKYGHLVLPNPSQNYGPTYFCKLQKVK